MIDDYKEVHDNILGNLVFPSYDKTIAGYIQRYGEWGTAERNWLTKNVKRGDTCVNIGANVGYFTCTMSKLTGTDGKVIAIEANPMFEEYLKENVKRTKESPVQIVMSAAGDYTGTIELYVNDTNCGDNRVFDPQKVGNATWDAFTGSQVVTVNIDKVDNILATEERIDVVFMDCQGWDHKIMRGMQQIIKKHKPKVMMEYVPKWIISMGEDPLGVLNEYANLGYNLSCPEINVHTPLESQDLLRAITNNKKAFVSICLT